MFSYHSLNSDDLDWRAILLVHGYKTIAPFLSVTLPCTYIFATKKHFKRAAGVSLKYFYLFMFLNECFINIFAENFYPR